MKIHRVSAIVLAAGLGTRVAALTKRRPKPLLPVGLTTPLAYAAARLRNGGIFRVIANASYRAEDVVAAGEAIGVEVVIERDGPLGTAGGVAWTRDRLLADGEDAVVIWNGDVISPIDVRPLVDALDRDASIVGALSIHGDLPAGEGNVGLDARGFVVRFRERFGDGEVRGAWFSAVHAVRRAMIEALPSRGDLIVEGYLPAIARGGRVVAVRGPERWVDVGDLAQYLAANLSFLEGRSAIVADDVTIGHMATLDRAVIGRGARVEGRGVVREVVAWPGARVVAPVERAVILDDGEIVAIDRVG